ncbi:MAG: VCBS repeat-containing protein [Cytophagales bacterium]|nr:VCBS repeat-containing protein [Cytophagales bacterium]
MSVTTTATMSPFTENTTTTGVINASSFATKVDFATGENPWNIAIDDFDLDGKPDLAVVNDVSNNVSVLRNQTTTGIINATSFAAAVNFTTKYFLLVLIAKIWMETAK